MMLSSAVQILPLPDMAEPALEQLRAWQAGDDSAFTALVKTHQEAAYACAWRVLGGGAEAADVVQEAFLRVVRHAARYDGRPFRPWLLGIVRHLAIDVLRRRRPQVGDEALAAAPAEAASAEDPALLRQRVAEVLAGLPEKYRQLLIMRELEGLPAQTVAAQLGLDYELCRWRLSEARRRFRDLWTARFGEEY